MEHITQKELNEIDFLVQTDYKEIGPELIIKLFISYFDLKKQLENKK